MLRGAPEWTKFLRYFLFVFLHELANKSLIKNHIMGD